MQLEPLLKELRGRRHDGGRPRKYELRRIVDGMLYEVKRGCQWRQMPSNFPPWQSVYQQYRNWRDCGAWERVTQRLREQGHAHGGDRRFAVCQDGAKRGQRGYDAGKKVKDAACAPVTAARQIVRSARGGKPDLSAVIAGFSRD